MPPQLAHDDGRVRKPFLSQPVVQSALLSILVIRHLQESHDRALGAQIAGES